MQHIETIGKKITGKEKVLEENGKCFASKRFIVSYIPGRINRFFSLCNNEQPSASQQCDIGMSANPAGGPFDSCWKPERLEQFWLLPIPNRETMEEHAWNSNDSSPNIFIGPDPFTMHRLPIAQSTDAVRGKVGFSQGFHVWEIIWPVKRRGTHAVIGVGTKAAALHNCGYISLVGIDEESYGWDLVHKKCLHGSKVSNAWSYPAVPLKEVDNGNVNTIPDRLLCILDMDNGYLAFSSFQQYYGVAFTGLKGKTLFPMVSAVWGHCEIKIVYLGSLPPEPRSLKDICRGEVRIRLGNSVIRRLDELELPKDIVKYLLNT